MEANASQSVLNVSSYRFVTLDGLDAWQAAVKDAAHSRALKGTVLLAPEGINLFLAGDATGVRGFVAWLQSQAGMQGLDAKESWSARVPFKRLLVKVKREIIRMNTPVIRPDQAPRAPAVTPEVLQRWLTQGHDDAGRPVVMLDTRNAFEVARGQFVGAEHWHLSKFSEFPQALALHRAGLEGKTVVSYCTGGIRCEKAALVMQQMGLEHTHQLEGGILRYFERVGQAHWQGECFVFDERAALDASLTSPHEACHAL